MAVPRCTRCGCTSLAVPRAAVPFSAAQYQPPRVLPALSRSAQVDTTAASPSAGVEGPVAEIEELTSPGDSANQLVPPCILGAWIDSVCVGWLLMRIGPSRRNLELAVHIASSIAISRASTLCLARVDALTRRPTSWRSRASPRSCAWRRASRSPRRHRPCSSSRRRSLPESPGAGWSCFRP